MNSVLKLAQDCTRLNQCIVSVLYTLSYNMALIERQAEKLNMDGFAITGLLTNSVSAISEISRNWGITDEDIPESQREMIHNALDRVDAYYKTVKEMR